MNWLDNVAIYLLTAFSTLFVKPAPISPDWDVVGTGWQKAEIGYQFIARSRKIVSECKANPKAFVQFPMVVLGTHEIALDNKTIVQFGDKTFRSSRSFYGVPTLKCSDLVSGSILEWRAYSLSQTHSIIMEMPKIIKTFPLVNIFSEPLTLIGAGALLVIALFVFAIFFGRVSHQFTFTVVFSCLFLSGYFLVCVAGLVELHWTFLKLHRLVNIFLWLGFLSFSNGMRISGYFGWSVYGPFCLSIFFAFVWFLFAQTSDGIQIGAYFPFITGLLLLLFSIIKKTYALIKTRCARKELFEVMSLLFFSTACLNDIGMIIHVFNTYPCLSIGLMGGMLLFILSANEKINSTYAERDHLRENLETEVKEKTAHLQRALIHLEKAQKEILQISSQIAHDIRSPLTALSVISTDVPELPEEKRIVLKMAIDRVNDIANTNAYRKFENSSAEIQVFGKTTMMLSSLVDRVITEKRIQYRSRMEVSIHTTLDQNAYGLFVEVDETELERMISNLVNNAVESISSNGSVQIHLKSELNKAVLTIKDTGKGIHPDLIEKLGVRGMTSGKKGGTGLGLAHAKTNLALWDANLSIQSTLGKGTILNIQIPLAQPPSWFVNEINIQTNSLVVVIDDDVNIHRIWDQRFAKISPKTSIVHLSSPEHLVDWMEKNQLQDHSIFLMDYEFVGSKVNGIAVAQELGVLTQTVLVTSRYEDEAVISSCTNLSLGLVPKRLAGLVPIVVSS